MSPTILPPRQRWSDGVRPGGPDTGLTGRHVLRAFLAFFAAIFVMNGALIYAAVSTNSGLVANEPYRKGLHYNARIAADEHQARLGWSEKLDVAQDGAMSLVLTDRAGQPVSGLRIETVLGRPATNRDDVRMALIEVAPGRYEAHTAPLGAGSWLAALEARAAADTEEPVYRLRRRLWFSP
jgi:nitrogen fixation protein FixH